MIKNRTEIELENLQEQIRDYLEIRDRGLLSDRTQKALKKYENELKRLYKRECAEDKLCAQN